jgi:hypothetical protein
VYRLVNVILGPTSVFPFLIMSNYRSAILCSLEDSFIHSSVAPQPFVGPWPLIQFRNLFYTDGKSPWTGDQPVTRPLPAHRITQTHIHTLSGIRNHDPSFRANEDILCLRPRDNCDRRSVYYHNYITVNTVTRLRAGYPENRG